MSLNLVEIIGISGFVVALVSFLVGSFFLGGRRWRGNYEAVNVTAERLKATLIEKDQIMAGMAERLSRLDLVVQELGGQKVYEAMIESQHRNLELFQGITQAIKDGDREITDAIRDLTHTLYKAANGKE